MANKKNRKEAYYFSHDSNAHRDEKIIRLIADYEYWGYGVFWLVVETLREAKDFKLSFESRDALAYSFRIEKEDFIQLIDDCILKYKLFESDSESYWSNSLLERMVLKEEKRQQKIDAGKKGSEKRWGNNDGNIIKPFEKNSVANHSDSKSNEITIKENKANQIVKGNQSETNGEYKEIIDETKLSITKMIFEQMLSYETVRKRIEKMLWQDEESKIKMVQFAAREHGRYEKELNKNVINPVSTKIVDEEDDNVPY